MKLCDGRAMQNVRQVSSADSPCDPLPVIRLEISFCIQESNTLDIKSPHFAPSFLLCSSPSRLNQDYVSRMYEIRKLSFAPSGPTESP
jgi:hypothetical protein